MSHNATYAISIRNANRDILAASLKWLEQKGECAITTHIRVWRDNMKVQGIGVVPRGQEYGLDIRIEKDGTITCTGESMGRSGRFRNLLEQTYQSFICRMAMMKMGYQSEMRITGSGVEVVGVQE